MKRTSLDIYDDRPKPMINYLKYYGWHFNKKMYEFAIDNMYKDGKKLLTWAKENVDKILKTHNIELKNNVLWDYMYVAAMCKADFYGDSIITDELVAKYIKNVIDDEDGYDGIVFSRWYCDTVKKGLPIDWENML